MKRIGILLCILIFLTGCSSKQTQMDRAMDLRTKLLAKAATFDAEITADYGDKTYTFSLYQIIRALSRQLLSFFGFLLQFTLHLKSIVLKYKVKKYV